VPGFVVLWSAVQAIGSEITGRNRAIFPVDVSAQSLDFLQAISVFVYRPFNVIEYGRDRLPWWGQQNQSVVDARNASLEQSWHALSPPWVAGSNQFDRRMRRTSVTPFDNNSRASARGRLEISKSGNLLSEKV
jgi:hypothetical protein